MQKPISRMQHGIADWLLIPLVAASPYLLGFAGVTMARSLAWISAVVIASNVILTRAEWGLVRVLPYKVHLLADAGLGLLLLVAPFIFRFAEFPAARNTFLALGVALVVASTVLSRRGEMPEPAGVRRNPVGL